MRYFWDVVWSVIVVQSLVIAAWRGLWTLADLYLYPEQPILSALITIVSLQLVCLKILSN